jgi:CHASE3 domain sensor protein
MAISIRIYTQLDSAVVVERTLVEAQSDLDGIVQTQVYLQSQVRGYVATGDSEFVEAYDDATTTFDKNVAKFERTTTGLHVARLVSVIADMRDLHASWKSEVATPLMHDRHAADARTRATLGKLFVDEMLGDTYSVRALLQRRRDEAEGELKSRINEGLVGGIGSILVFGLVSIVFVTSRVQMQEVIDRERSIVETLGGAFRTDLDRLPGARVGTAYLSADRDAAVGGDLYDVRRIDDNRGLVLVADVSGKGIDAAVNTAFVKYSIRAIARRTDDPAAILAEFNLMFLETVSDPNLFVVGFVGIFDGPGGTFVYASAGHSGAYLRRGTDVRPLDVTGPIVGLDKSFGYENRTLALASGDRFLLATDGLTEARDRTGELLGDAGAMALFAGTDAADPQQCADAMVARVRERGGGALSDDLALLVIAVDA